LSFIENGETNYFYNLPFYTVQIALDLIKIVINNIPRNRRLENQKVVFHHSNERRSGIPKETNRKLAVVKNNPLMEHEINQKKKLLS
jgi:hypothetical protein